MPIGLGGVVPENVYYYHIKKNEHARPKVLYQENYSQKKITSNNFEAQGNYLNFTIDPNGIIENVTYLGTKQIQLQSLIQFVGIH